MDPRTSQPVQRRHNGPDPFHLQIPTIPTFPFSSPIVEEVVTPYPDSDSPERRINNPFRSSDDSLPSVTGNFPNNNECDLGQRPVWDSASREKEANQDIQTVISKKARPDLNLVTNFTSSGTRQAAENDRKLPAKSFLDLNDLKSLSKSKSNDLAQDEGSQRAWKTKARGYQELRDDTDGFGHVRRVEKQSLLRMISRKAKRPIKDLSPSDRPILIGLSVPADQVVNTEATGQKAQQTPVTPSIVITPAVEDRYWDSSWNAQKTQKTRPPSSVYSQPTPFMKPNRIESIPPVPAIPALNTLPNSDKHVRNLVDESPQQNWKRRSCSAGVYSDNELSPQEQYTLGRSLSNDSRLTLPNRLSLETISNRRRSQGWWNVLLSPMLSRSSTVSTRYGARAEDGSPPPIPTMILNPHTPHSHNIFNEKQWGSGVSAFSPDTPEERNGNKTQSGITAWPDLGDWDKGRENRNMNAGIPHSPDYPNDVGNETSPKSASSTQTIPFVMSTTINQGRAFQNMPCQHGQSSNEQCSICIGRSKVDRFLAETATSSHGSFPDSQNKFAFSQSPISHQIPDNPFFQRFVADLRNEEARRSRSDSGSTTIEDDEPEFSPHLRKATATPLYWQNGATPTFVQPSAAVPISTTPPTRVADKVLDPVAARKPSNPTWATHDPRASDSIPPPYSSPTPSKVRRYRAIFPPGQQPYSPGPISPEGNNITAVRGGIPLSGVGGIRHPPAVYQPGNSAYDPNKSLPPRPVAAPVTLASINGPAGEKAKIETRRRRHEKEDAVGKKVGGLWRGRGCFSNRGCFGRGGREGRRRRRWWFVLIILLLVLVITSIIVAILVTRKRGEPPEVQSRWLNLTGYPAMPTGVSTIGGPDPVDSNPQCVHPSTLWSCALPWEDRKNQQYDSDMPNFKIQIAFKNGTYPHSTAVKTQVKRSIGFDGFMPQTLLHRTLQSRDEDFTPNPAPPHLEDIEFLANTTDGVASPYIGEETPFYATFLSMASRGNQEKRHSARGILPNLTDIIPQPKSAPDGTAPPAVLYPLPINQPLRLFDRGLPTEHYGFFTYFDRSIFLKSTAPINASGTAELQAEKDGGVPKPDARVQCTWSQTRFLVQIWTEPGKGNRRLLGDPRDATNGTAVTDYSSDFTRPGTFPYPVTIKLDRHGGDAKKKMVYCYGINQQSQIELNQRKLQLEFRDRGGILINPAAGIFNLTQPGKKTDRRDDAWRPIDGGTAGCKCEWRNFYTVRD